MQYGNAADLTMLCLVVGGALVALAYFLASHKRNHQYQQQPWTRGEWVVAKRTLHLWSAGKLAGFNDLHLGDDASHGKNLGQLRAEALEVIEAFIQAVEPQRHNSQPAQTAETGQAEAKPVPQPLSPVASSSADEHPQVVLSYQSQSYEFMVRLRCELNRRNIRTIDGTQVPCGNDWREFFFLALKRAAILIPILSKGFMFSRACASELTSAEDHAKHIVPVVHDFEYEEVLRNPEKYIVEGGSIEPRMAKFTSILNPKNRIPRDPKYGSFATEDGFIDHADKLIEAIHSHLNSIAGRSSAAASDESSWPWDGLTGDAGLDQMIKTVNDPSTGLELMREALTQLNHRLYPAVDTRSGASDYVPVEADCEFIIERASSEVLNRVLSDSAGSWKLGVAAADIVKTVCIPGGHFGDGLIDVRRVYAKSDILKSLLLMLKIPSLKELVMKASDQLKYANRACAETGLSRVATEAAERKEEAARANYKRALDDWKSTKHSAILALSYITRSKTGKINIGQVGGIPILLALMKETGDNPFGHNDQSNCIGTLNTTLAILWNCVYIPENRVLMKEKGIIDAIRHYLQPLDEGSPSDEHFLQFKYATEAGFKDSLFIMSHLAREYPDEVFKSDIHKYAIDLLQCRDMDITPVTQQTVESVCRLIWSISCTDKWATQLYDMGAADALLESLKLDLRPDFRIIRTQTKISASQTTDADKAPVGGHKIRAASALANLVQKAGAKEIILEFIDGIMNKSEPEHFLVWLAVEPVLKNILIEHHSGYIQPANPECHHRAGVQLFFFRTRSSLQKTQVEMDPSAGQMMRPKSISINSLEHCTWSNDCSGAHDNKRQYSDDLVIFLIALANEENELEQLLETALEDGTKLRRKLLAMFSNGDGHKMCARWALLCKALAPAKAWPHTLAQGQFAEDLTAALIEWLQGGHPYKCDASKLLVELVEQENLARFACTKVCNKPKMLQKETLEKLNTDAGWDPTKLAPLKKAFTELESQ